MTQKKASMKKAKPRKAWGIVLRNGKLGAYAYEVKSDAKYAVENGERLARIEIREIQ